MLLSFWATTLSGCTATPQSMVHQKLCTLIWPLARSSDTSAMPAHLRAGIVEIGEAKRAAFAFLAPFRHLRHPLDRLDGARRALQQLEMERNRIDAALARDLVDERFGGEPVGQ